MVGKRKQTQGGPGQCGLRRHGHEFRNYFQVEIRALGGIFCRLQVNRGVHWHTHGTSEVYKKRGHGETLTEERRRAQRNLTLQLKDRRTTWVQLELSLDSEVEAWGYNCIL